MELDTNLAYGVVGKVVNSKLWMFSSYAHKWTRKDLVAHCMFKLANEWKNYNPAKSKPSTFITMLATRRLYDLCRDLTRANRKDHQIMAAAEERAVDPCDLGPSLKNEADTESLADWLHNIHRMIRRNFSVYHIPLNSTAQTGRPPCMDRAQAAALLALKRRLHLSCRGASQLIRERDDLRRAIGIDWMPSRCMFHRIERSIPTVNFSKSVSKQTGE